MNIVSLKEHGIIMLKQVMLNFAAFDDTNNFFWYELNHDNTVYNFKLRLINMYELVLCNTVTNEQIRYVLTKTINRRQVSILVH